MWEEMMINRAKLVEIIKPWALSKPHICAAWEGGSAATNRMDQYSDLDLTLVVDDDKVEDTFTDFESFLTNQFQIIRKYRLPEPAWHGFSQCFYQIDQLTPYLYLDIAVMKKSQPEKLMEEDRHGIAHVWIDKDNIYHPSPSSKEVINQRVNKMIESIKQTDFIMMIEIEKGIERGLFLDVFPTYYSFIGRHMAILLNALHRPEKVDFGLRYAQLDYDNEDRELIEKALKVSNIHELKDSFDKIKARYNNLLSHFDNNRKD
jgi:hypothetical protein